MKELSERGDWVEKQTADRLQSSQINRRLGSSEPSDGECQCCVNVLVVQAARERLSW